MKTICKRFLILFLLIALIPASVFATAAETETADTTYYYADGSYMVVELVTVESRATSSKTGTKNYTYYGSDNTVQWKGTLSATFEYDGTSATCVTAVCTVGIVNRDWYTISKSSGKSGNTANGYLTMGRKVLGVTVEQKSVTMTMSCSPTGVIS